MQLPTSVPVGGEQTPDIALANHAAAAEAAPAALYGDDDLLDDWDDPDLWEVGIPPPALRLRLAPGARRLALPAGSAQ